MLVKVVAYKIGRYRKLYLLIIIGLAVGFVILEFLGFPQNYSSARAPAFVRAPASVRAPNSVRAPASARTPATAISHKLGHVNVHLWNKMCSSTIGSLRMHPLFPLWPSVRGQPQMPDELVSIMDSMWSAQRIMGLLYPPMSGIYRFEIKSSTLSEFWLSSSEDPAKVVLLARNNKNVLYGVNFARGPSMSTSRSIPLTHDQPVYFEINHVMNDINHDQVQVRWMLPNARLYTAIPKTCLSTVIKNDMGLDVKTREFLRKSASLTLQERSTKNSKSYQWINTNFSSAFRNYPTYTRESLYTCKFADRKKIMSIFEECEYAPSYVIKKKYPRYRGVENTHYSDVFPSDGTQDKIWDWCERAHLCRGNAFIKESIVIGILKQFLAQLEAKFPGEYKLVNVVNVEHNADEKRGDRFFLELVLLEIKSKELQRLSEYFYQVKNTSTICKPKGMVWSPTVKINAIVTSKNQGPWIVHYIENMAKVIHTTNDENVHFVIADYGNNDVDIEGELQRNGLTKYTVIKMNGVFHKTLAIREAVNSIQDQNSIVFLTDLHLDTPSTLFESVRKHTIQGILGFTPVVFRLTRCGRPETEQTQANGYWDGYAFGIISVFKSDWDVFGGVNVEEYKNRWGGEDWEMIDRVLEKGYEVERLRLPYFYHFSHDKSGMWDKA